MLFDKSKQKRAPNYSMFISSFTVISMFVLAQLKNIFLIYYSTEY